MQKDVLVRQGVGACLTHRSFDPPAGALLTRTDEWM